MECAIAGQAAFAFDQRGQDDEGCLPHGPGFDAEGDKADESGEGHFEIFVMFPGAQEGQVVDPFGVGPEIPELPEEPQKSPPAPRARVRPKRPASQSPTMEGRPHQRLIGSRTAQVPTQMARLESGVPRRMGMGARRMPRRRMSGQVILDF